MPGETGYFNGLLGAAGAPVEHAIDLAASVEAMNIDVRVSVGKQKRGLALDIVKRTAETLYDIGGSALDKLVVDGSDAEGETCETLDLLNARVYYEIDVPETTRELDRQDCQRKLARILREVVAANNDETLF